MTQKLKFFTIGLLLMGVLGHPALADTGNRDHGLSQEELTFIFGGPNADGFEILSPEEMAKIEGEWTFFSLRQAFYSGALHAWVALRKFGGRLSSYRMRFGNHPPHHGLQRHLELIIYRKGSKGSDRKFIYDYDRKIWKHLPPDRTR